MKSSEMSKAAKVRDLYNQGKTVAEIKELTGMRYQHVYNIVSQVALKEGSEVRVNRHNGEKKAAIVQMLSEGKTVKEIVRTVDSYETYVRKVKKEWLAMR